MRETDSAGGGLEHEANMNIKLTIVALVIACTFSAFAQTSTTDIPPELSTPDTVETRLGTMRFKDGVPAAATAARAYDHMDAVHAEGAFYNAFSAVNMWALRKGFLAAGVNDGEVLLFSGLMDAK